MAAIKSTHLYGGGHWTEWTEIINHFVSPLTRYIDLRQSVHPNPELELT
jgi:hypothetical protein